jgi:hypothetical protein
MGDLTAEEWARIDAGILARAYVPLLIWMVRGLGWGLGEAKQLYMERYDQLREQRPNDFAYGEDDYWRGTDEDMGPED